MPASAASVAAFWSWSNGSLVAAFVALGAWAALFGVLALLNRPRAPASGKEALELAGDESPAVANLLTHRWRLRRSAVPATLLDLVARGYLAIDSASTTSFIFRVTDRTPPLEDLTDYESRVLTHVRSRAVEGVVPGTALTTGKRGTADSWWLRFRREVVADARQRGLSRPRWQAPARSALLFTGLLPTILFAYAARSSHGGQGAWATFGQTYGPMAAILMNLRMERDTPAGLEAASRWLGLRNYLARNQQFAVLPPSAVATWERFIAYGTALGVAPGAAEGLGLGADSDRNVWSSYGGRWHRVHIRWPWMFQVWGNSPGMARFGGLYFVVMGGVAAAMTAIPWLLVTYLARSNRWAGPGGVALFALSLILLALPGVVGLVLIVHGLRLLGIRVFPEGARVQVTGQVLRTRPDPGLVAVDDGTSSIIRAWTLPFKHPALVRGAIVRATVSSRAHHVHDIEVLEEPKAPPEIEAPQVESTAEYDSLGETLFGSNWSPVSAGGAPVALPTAADIDRATGVAGFVEQPGPATGAPDHEVGGWASYAAPDGSSVMIGVAPQGPVDTIGMLGRMGNGGLMGRFFRGVQMIAVPGLGDKAVWYAGSTLMIDVRGRLVTIVPRLANAPLDGGLEAAKAIAHTVVDPPGSNLERPHPVRRSREKGRARPRRTLRG